VEGPIREITYNPDGTATMLVQDVTVHVPASLPIDSPTTVLTVRQLCIRNRLPGRTEPGFLGGTALINGVVDLSTRKFTATDVTVEPAENVVIGVITSVSPLRIQGTEVALSTDPRIITRIVNTYGFPSRLDGISVGQPAAAAARRRGSGGAAAAHAERSPSRAIKGQGARGRRRAVRAAARAGSVAADATGGADIGAAGADKWHAAGPGRAAARHDRRRRRLDLQLPRRRRCRCPRRGRCASMHQHHQQRSGDAHA
jgi:hypothetical protein